MSQSFTLFKFKNLFLGFTFLCAILYSQSIKAQYDLVVAQDGSGNYTTVQAAVNAAPVGRTTPYLIFIKNGTYNEKINIPATKPFIKLVGENVAHVVLTYNDYAAKLTSCTNTVGTQNSASFTINSNDFSAVNITFVNSYGDGSQAVAVLTNSDRCIFLNCRFLANQDTVYLKGSGAPRTYFKNCYIDGNVDFIFGSAIALFDSCVIYAKSRTTAGTSYITAPNTPNGQAYGFVFRDARLPKNTGSTQYYLSRPWPSPDEASTRQKTVFLSSRMSTHVRPEGWSVWNANTVTANLYYGEYNSRYFNGANLDVSQRTSWSYQLNATDSASYTLSNIFGTWNPCTSLPELCASQNTSLAISNFKGVKGASSAQFSWNATWPVNGIAYTLYRSTDNITYSPVYSFTEPTDSMVNFSYTDPTLPASGSAWYYYVNASRAGYASEVSDTISISNKSNFIVNASAALSYCGFSQMLGTPSATQTFTLVGSNLTSNITITPPIAFEVSSDNINWFNTANPLLLSPTAGTVNSTVVYLRLNASSIGNFNGNVTVASSGVSDFSFAITGITYGPSTSFPLQHWPMTQNNSDSANVRSAAVTASTSTLNGLFTSDGTQPPIGPIPAYSGQYGQALGANTAGNNWSAVGGNMNRNYYEQFTVTAVADSQLRIDSITFLTDFYNTISGIKMGLVFSKNGFSTPADSTEFFSAIGPGGITMPLAAIGSFTKSFTLQRSDAGPINKYAISLNGIDGVTINPGETLTIRLYWGCGSTGTPRYAFLKDVKVVGLVLHAATTDTFELTSFEAYPLNDRNKLTWTTKNEQNLNPIEIQKSIDQVNFETIGQIAAQLDTVNSYSYEDVQPNNIQYYRLKFNNQNGSYFYSPIKMVKNDNKFLHFYPNPVIDKLTIEHEMATMDSKISIYNVLGKLIYSIPVSIGNKKIDIPTTTLAKGIYFGVYFNGQFKRTFKFVKD
jgi:pectinesterase